MKGSCFAAIAAVLLLLPVRAESQVNQCGSACCYCDLAAGQCKDISEFPGGGGTGYSNCNVNGMTCNYWGSSCRDEFAFAEVGPDGVIRTVADSQEARGQGTATAVARSTVTTSDGFTQERDCRRFLVGVRVESGDVAILAANTTTIIL